MRSGVPLRGIGFFASSRKLKKKLLSLAVAQSGIANCDVTIKNSSALPSINLPTNPVAPSGLHKKIASC